MLDALQALEEGHVAVAGRSESSPVVRVLWQVARGDLPGVRRPSPDEIGGLYEAILDERALAAAASPACLGGRRRTGSYYTPRSLADRIVARTIEPLVSSLSRGAEPTSELLLSLRVCDPAMGCGAFLLAACRWLSDRLVAAWRRERGALGSDASSRARSLVARRCLMGVDTDPNAVALARLALWLDVGADDVEPSFVDHALRHGDALVGISAAALERLGGTDLEPESARVAGDALVGAAISSASARARREERARREVAIASWLSDGPRAPIPPSIRRWAAEARERLSPLHWELELPSIWSGRALAVVGNPPFMGKNAIVARGGPAYLEWLQSLHPGAHGNADLSAHFLRRAAGLVGARGAIGTIGTIGFIATNTIAQGDTRATGLQTLVREGFEIYDAEPSTSWPGDASVSVSIVHLARGVESQHLRPCVDGVAVSAIDSWLRGQPERPDPAPLRANHGIGFVGSYVLGRGFVLTPEQREVLVREDPRNAERIEPYLGGADLNKSPTQAPTRYVIDFGARTLEEVRARWPGLLSIVEQEVAPSRARNNRAAYRERWWIFAERRPALYEALRPLSRCLVAARVSKHLCVAVQPMGRVFSEQLVVFATEDLAHLALLQSRVHELWARRLSSSLEDRLRYSVSGCFETFPMPTEVATLRELREVGAALHRSRAELMQQTGQGLTKTYNALGDPQRREPELEALRRLHVELEEAVARAYGWPELELPSRIEPVRPQLERAVIDRLFDLNQERAR